MSRPHPLLYALATAVLASGVACDKHDEPTPPPPPPSASITHPPIPSAFAARVAARTQRQPPESPAVAASKLPVAMREPDWGLDPADPAKDYVARYLKATKRYGDKSGCVTLGDSTFANGKSTVEARNDASGTCGTAGAVKDRFFVTVATDRMSLDPSLRQPPLAKWPDGSEPDSAAATVTDVQDMRGWRAGLHQAFHALQLAPLRLQLYGRGTYAVVSIAGWHGPVKREMAPAELAGPAKSLCDANDNSPLGIFAGLDRSTLLRITCGAGGASAHFETL